MIKDTEIKSNLDIFDCLRIWSQNPKKQFYADVHSIGNSHVEKKNIELAK